MAIRTLSQLEQAAERAQARHAAAQARLDEARQTVLDRSWEHHAAVIGQLGESAPAPTPPTRTARASAAAKDPVAAAQERLAAAIVEYDRVARELGVSR